MTFPSQRVNHHRREGLDTHDLASRAAPAHRSRTGWRSLDAHGRGQDAARRRRRAPGDARRAGRRRGVRHTIVVTNRPDALATPGSRTRSPSSPTRSPTRVRSAVSPRRWRTPTTSGCSRSLPTCRISSRRSSARSGRRARASMSCCRSATRAPSRCWRSIASRRVCPPRARCSPPAAAGSSRSSPALNVVEVPVESLRAVDPELRSLVNVNTPADLAEAVSMRGRRASGRAAPPSRARAHGGR